MTSAYSDEKGYVDDADVKYFWNLGRAALFLPQKWNNTLIRSNLGMVRWASSAGAPQASGKTRADTLFVHADIDMSWFNYVEIHNRLKLYESETFDGHGAFVDRLNDLVRQYLVEYSAEGTDNKNVPNQNSPMSTRTV